MPSSVGIVLCSTKSQWDDHARHLDDVAQLDLAPRAARGRPLERRHEVAGLLAQRADALAELADHLRELALRLAALALEAADLALHAPELLLHGDDEPLDLLRAPGHLAARALLLGAARVREPLRERVAGLREHVERDRLQRLAHPLALAAQVKGDARRARCRGGDEEHCARDVHPIVSLIGARKHPIRGGRHRRCAPVPGDAGDWRRAAGPSAASAQLA